MLLCCSRNSVGSMRTPSITVGRNSKCLSNGLNIVRKEPCYKVVTRRPCTTYGLVGVKLDLPFVQDQKKVVLKFLLGHNARSYLKVTILPHMQVLGLFSPRRSASSQFSLPKISDLISISSFTIERRQLCHLSSYENQENVDEFC